MGIGLNIVASGFGCESILNYGSEEQKKCICLRYAVAKKYVLALIRSRMPERMFPDIKQGR